MSHLSYSTQSIDEDDIVSLIEVLKSPFLTQGPKVQEFEEDLAIYTGAKFAISFNSATSALQASYAVASISKGDEIITSPISFVATSNMILACGATPVWCDIKKDGNIDEKKIEALISSKTKAIVPIHFAGKPVEIEKIHSIAKKHKLLVIEDAAHALGSSIGGQKIGSFSDMTIFSFHAIKPITTGEGGAVLTDNEEYARRLKLIRSHGMIKKELWDSDMTSLGYNFRMSEFAGALGTSQLKKLDNFIEIRNSIASYYDKRFKEEKLFTVQNIDKFQRSSRHLYPIFLQEQLQVHKKKIFKELQENDLGVQVHYKPIYENSFYKEHLGKAFCQGADAFYKAEISIPCHQKMNLNDAKYVADTLIKILSKYSKK